MLKRELGAGLEAGERRAQVVRDVVERIAHGADERLVALEHAVEERDEFVDFVLGARIGHAGAHVAGLDDGADRADDFADRAERAIGDESAAAKAERDDGDHDEKEDDAEVAQQFVAVFGGAAHVHDGAVGQRRAGDGPDHVLLGGGTG